MVWQIHSRQAINPSKREDKTIRVLSYGAGVNSSALLLYLLPKKAVDCVIFSDTGEEHEHTYFNVMIARTICKRQNIDFYTVRSKYGNIYDYYMEKKAIPSIMRRDCTSKFKISPIRNYMNAKYPNCKFLFYIGIAYEEMGRVTTPDVNYISYCYPFVDDKITRDKNKEMINGTLFIPRKSGCKGCPLQPKREWEKMKREDPKEFLRWLILEENNQFFPKQYLRGSKSMRDINPDKPLKVQTPLEDDKEMDLLCPNTAGGCFL